MTRRLLCLLVAVAALTACGSDPGPPAVGTSPMVVVEMIDGMLAPMSRWTLPEFALLGDGTAVVRAKAPGIVLAGTRRTLSKAQVEDLYQRAGDAGLFRDREFHSDVEDGGLLRVRVVSTDGDHVTRVPVPSVRDSGARGRIAAFAAAAPTLGDPAGPYAFRTAAVIRLADFGSSTEERPWPLSTPPAAMPGGPYRPCVTVTGAELDTLLATVRTATWQTRWTAGGTRYGLLIRPLLPYEHTCADF